VPDTHIILAGQSNALGYLNDGPASYVPTARVQIWADTDGDGAGDAWNYMLPGVNTGTPANPHDWGPEVGFAEAWLTAHAGDQDVLWIVKVTKGSTGLAQDAGQLDWSPASHGEMFDAATSAEEAARRNLDATPYAFAEWDGLLWMQGETDATDPAKANAYAANERAFIAAAREAWHVDDVVVGRIGAAGAWSEVVRDAQWNLDHGDDPMTGVESFRTIGLPMQPDGLHYDAAGQVALGAAFYGGWVI
jgi:hypothetical protein